LKDCLEVICSNDQTDLLLYFEKYAKLSEVSLKKIELDKFNFGESYLFKSLKMGKIDTNFFPHSTLLPSEVHDEYINYQKGCFIGQEVVSRIKHRQLQKKIILVFERIIPGNTKFPDNFELLIEIKNLLVLRLPKDVDFSYLEKEFDIKKI
jgi:folate-binding protein YgfZ